MNLAKKLKEFRVKNNFTMKKIAIELKVPLSTYRDWEYGRKIPAEHLTSIAKVFNVSVDYLLGHRHEKTGSLQQAIYHFEEGLQMLKNLK